jgi:hypothetical protein
MIDDDVLIGRVAESLRAHAGAVTVRERPFDPTRRLAEVVELGPARRGRPRARVRLAVAAAALLAVVAVGVAQLAVGSGGGGEREPELIALVPPRVPAPSDGLAATWLPDGWRLAAVDWSTPAGTTSSYGPLRPIEWDSYGARAQLFEDRGHPGAALLVESEGGVVTQDGVGRAVTVRGHQGQVARSDVDPEVTVVTWLEGSTQLRASVRGLGPEQAVAALDGLVTRPGGPAAGFDVPRAGGLVPVDEAEGLGEAATHVGLTVEAPGSGRRGPHLSVHTVSPAGRSTVPYLVASLYGERAGDGTATLWDASTSTRLVVRGDGQVVRVQAFTLDEDDTLVPAAEVPGVGPAVDVTARAAGSIEPVTSSQLMGWWDEVNTRRMRLRLQARVELPTATIEVRGEGDQRALCNAKEAETVCALVIPGAPDGPDAETLWTTLHIGGDDYQVAASAAGRPRFVATGDEGDYTMDAETGRDGDWHVALARPALDPFTVEVD